MNILCLNQRKGILGCACYANEDLKLLVMEDITVSLDLAFIQPLILQLSPHCLLVPDSSETEFISLLENYQTFKITKLPQKNFNFLKGQYTFLNWYTDCVQAKTPTRIIFKDQQEQSKTHAFLKLEGLIDSSASQLTIGCAGVLLDYLSDSESNPRLPDQIQVFSTHERMFLSNDTIKSLNLFEYEPHPNMHLNQQKESLSLFGLLNKTKTPLGEKKLKEWVLYPTTNKSIIEERHASIAFFIQADVRKELLELRTSLSFIPNIYRLLSNIRECKASTNDWHRTLKFILYTLSIFDVLTHLKEKRPTLQIFQKIETCMNCLEDIKVIGAEINDLIDFETSKQEGRLTINKDFDLELDHLKKEYSFLDDYLLQVAQQMSVELPVDIGACLNVIYFPQMGYLVTFPKNRSISSDIYGLLTMEDYIKNHLPEFQLQFITADNVYYKNDRTKELDETLGDIHTMIVDREIEIAQRLSQRVLEYKYQFTELEKTVSLLDCLLSFSVIALKYNYSQPVMTETNLLEIDEGRHPLQEVCMTNFIPNNTRLQGGEGYRDGSMSSLPQPDEETIHSIQLLTGANFSGKSVYLKQVALIVYMAHVGSFIPAKSATIGITDKIFTRTQTLETISKPQSAFVYDLQQIKKALVNSTCQSLVIIDEFGKGTENTDGAALFCSVLGYFLSKGTQCPKVLSSTHFHDTISKNILSSQERMTFSHTEIIYQQVDSLNGGPKKDDVVFLYRIIPGIGSLSSYGIWCAGIAGLPTEIIERSIVLSNKYSKGEEIDKVVKEKDRERFLQLETIATEFLKQDIMEGNPYDTIKSISNLFK